MKNEQLLARLTSRMYDAGLGTNSWDAAVDDVMQAIGAEVSALFIVDRSRTPAATDVVAHRGFPENAPDRYSSYFSDRDVQVPPALRLMAGQIYLDDRTMPFAQVERSEIYHDFYRPIGVAHCMGAVPFNDGRRFGILSAHRATRAGSFRPEEIARFEHISPHLTRALQLQRQVARANAVAGGLVVALDHFPMAVLLANEEGAVIEVNLAAEALLRRPECPLRLVAKRLSAVSSSDTAVLTRAIADAACTSRGRISAAPPVLRLAKISGRGAIGVMVTPEPRTEEQGITAGGFALVFLVVLGQAPPNVPDLLTGPRGLSPAEAGRGTARSGRSH